MSTLKLEKRISTLENFQVLVRTFEKFPGTRTLKKEIQKYVQNATSDFTGISKSSSIKKAFLRLTCSKALVF